MSPRPHYSAWRGCRDTSEPIGETLIAIGAMTTDQVKRILKLQKQGDSRLFGQIAIELGFIDDDAIEKYLARKSGNAPGD